MKKKLRIKLLISVAGLFILFLLFVFYVDCFKHTHPFIVQFRKSFKIGKFYNFLEGVGNTGVLLTIITIIYKYFIKKDKEEKICGTLEKYELSKDEKRLTLYLSLTNEGNYPIGFEFIKKENKSSFDDLAFYFCYKENIKYNKHFNFEPIFLLNDGTKEDISSNNSDYMKFSSDDRASTEPTLIRDGKNSKRFIRCFKIFKTNDVYNPIVVNNEIYQNFIYMGVLDDNDELKYHQNILLPSKQNIRLRLDISKGYKIKKDIMIKRICLYSKAGTLFTININKKKKVSNKNARNERKNR